MSDKQTEKTIQLDTPIKRGKTEITEIVLRKPQSGALRGTRLQAIMDMDVNAMITVIPRISSPALPPIYRIEAPTQIIIQTQPGQSAQDIAREVARQLDERERRLKAKARSNYSDQGGYDA